MLDLCRLERHWHDNNKEVEVTCYTTASLQWNGTRRIVLEFGGGGSHFGQRPLDALEGNCGSRRTVYKAKRASSVRSVFLWEPLGVRAGWVRLAVLGPGGDGTGSAALARSSRNLSNSERSKLVCQKHGSWGSQCYILNQYKGDYTFTGDPFFSSITFLLRRGKKTWANTSIANYQ